MDHVSIKDLKLFEINRELNHREIDRDFQETLDNSPRWLITKITVADIVFFDKYIFLVFVCDNLFIWIRKVWKSLFLKSKLQTNKTITFLQQNNYEDILN